MKKFIFASTLFVSPLVFAGQNVTLQAGESVTLNALSADTTVTCEGTSKVTCLCAVDGPGANMHGLALVNGQNFILTQDFGTASAQDCWNAVKQNPICQ